MPPTIQLEYRGDEPAWRLRVVQPGRFRDVRYEIKVRLFRLRQGALLGVLLNLYDIPDQPYFVHRVMDLTDPEVARYVERCSRRGRIQAVFEAAGEDRGFERRLELEPELWETVLREGGDHNHALDADGRTNGEAALEAFLNVFGPVSQEKGVEPAWDAVGRELEKRA